MSATCAGVCPNMAIDCATSRDTSNPGGTKWRVPAAGASSPSPHRLGRAPAAGTCAAAGTTACGVAPVAPPLPPTISSISRRSRFTCRDLSPSSSLRSVSVSWRSVLPSTPFVRTPTAASVNESRVRKSAASSTLQSLICFAACFSGFAPFNTGPPSRAKSCSSSSPCNVDTRVFGSRILVSLSCNSGNSALRGTTPRLRTCRRSWSDTHP